jgi:hypothetical protein
VISKNPASYSGTCGFSQGTFTTANYENQLDGGTTSDGIIYLFEQMSGNGTLIARVSNTASVGQAASKVGLMMRETLDPASKEVSLRLYSLNAPAFNPSVTFGARMSSGASSVDFGGNPATAGPYWLKLTRSGNTFSAYTSPDGVKWTQIGKPQSVSMNSNILVGFAAAAEINGWFSQTATFDHVTAPVKKRSMFRFK